MGVGAAPVITGSGVGIAAGTGGLGFGVSGSAFTAVAEAGKGNDEQIKFASYTRDKLLIDIYMLVADKLFCDGKVLGA